MKRVPRRFGPGRYELRIKKSRAGRGLFTYTDIAPGACIIEYRGRKRRQAGDGKRRREIFLLDEPQHNDRWQHPEQPARFINHSCAPNCEIDIRHKRIYVFAKRTIKAGEELNYDYDKEYFNEHIKPLGCVCDKCLRKRAGKREIAALFHVTIKIDSMACVASRIFLEIILMISFCLVKGLERLECRDDWVVPALGLIHDVDEIKRFLFFSHWRKR